MVYLIGHKCLARLATHEASLQYNLTTTKEYITMELPAPDFERLGPPAKSTILVIGGCGGIGYAFASAAAQLGCNVIVMDLPAAISRRSDIPGTRPISIDLRDEPSIIEAFNFLKELGVTLNSIAVCSGYTKGHDQISVLETDRFDDVISGNLRGPVLAIREARALLANESSIVFLSTAIGQIGAPGYAGYGAAKAGLNAVTRILAAELAPSVRVNAVAPGAVDTAFIRGGYGEGADDTGAPARFDKDDYNARVPLGRMAVSDDIIGPILFLLSDTARHITGQVLHVNGGAFMRD